MGDGAQKGIGAESAVKTAINGENPPEKPQMTPAEMEEMLRGADLGDTGYEGGANSIARMILEAWDKHPPLESLLTECEYLKDGSGQMVWPAVQMTVGLSDALKQVYQDEPAKLEIMGGMTGFMWGWAVNAARYCRSLPELPNPALLTIPRREPTGPLT